MAGLGANHFQRDILPSAHFVQSSFYSSPTTTTLALSHGRIAPTDNSLYAPNATFNVAGPGNLSLGSSPFFYWNTKADGTGNIFGQGSNIFPNQTTNLTLFAIWGVTTGLTNSGVTTNFNFFYDPSLGGAGGIEPVRINQLLAAGTGRKPVIENDFDWLQAQFAGVDMTKAQPFPIPVQVTAVVLSGYSASWGWPLSMNAGKNPATLLRCMAITEVSETFMLAQDKGWGFSNGVCDEESCGEALSLFLAVRFQLSQGLGTTWFMNRMPSTWLNTSLPASNPASTEFDANTGTHYGSRQDYVGSVKPWTGNGPATGCCMAFLYYLFHQLQFTSIPQIIAAAPGVDSSNNGPCSNNVIGGSCLEGSTSRIALLAPGVIIKCPRFSWWHSKAAVDKWFVRDMKRSFEVEERLLQILGLHPRIIEFKGVSDDPFGLLFTEASDGNLQNYIDQHHASIDMSLRFKWRTQAAEAIQFIYQKGVIHSDLRPENFLLHTVAGNEVDLLLCDFGGVNKWRN
ncbi:hypothetical protein NUU61_001383 [Penicillium alfredii]|uniref:EKC/KEOPS complex subunit BUD32 n=1 Tax=Penicillium alfredii TaxID=1506179 RepID=A0A9W9G4C9_9EURO|nr:uncharacterized protein NUU61_001383 [Penicillium alfredii]KAJ5111753.1 hypothetical protein NUU61_001383 [Penicillium alfredii]